MDNDIKTKLAGSTARIASNSCRITALQSVLEQVLPPHDPPFASLFRLELAKAHNEMFSLLTKIDPEAAQIFLEGNRTDD